MNAAIIDQAYMLYDHVAAVDNDSRIACIAIILKVDILQFIRTR